MTTVTASLVPARSARSRRGCSCGADGSTERGMRVSFKIAALEPPTPCDECTAVTTRLARDCEVRPARSPTSEDYIAEGYYVGPPSDFMRWDLPSVGASGAPSSSRQPIRPGVCT